MGRDQYDATRIITSNNSIPKVEQKTKGVRRWKLDSGVKPEQVLETLPEVIFADRVQALSSKETYNRKLNSSVHRGILWRRVSCAPVKVKN
jgi:hypothetical protein